LIRPVLKSRDANIVQQWKMRYFANPGRGRQREVQKAKSIIQRAVIGEISRFDCPGLDDISFNVNNCEQ